MRRVLPEGLVRLAILAVGVEEEEVWEKAAWKISIWPCRAAVKRRVARVRASGGRSSTVIFGGGAELSLMVAGESMVVGMLGYPVRRLVSGCGVACCVVTCI